MAATGTLLPFPLHQLFTNAGLPAVSYRLFTYTAGTTTKTNVYQDVALATPHSNPITLNSAGRPPAGIYLAPGSIKVVFAPPGSDDPPSSPVWTLDNISSVPTTNVALDFPGTAGEPIAAGAVVYLSDGSGGNTAGLWYNGNATNTFSSVTPNAIGMAPAAIATSASGSIRVMGQLTGLAGLTAGTLYYISTTPGVLTASAPGNARAVCVADSATSVILSQWIPILAATQTLSGIVSTTTQTFGGAKTFAALLTASLGLNITGAQGTFTAGTGTGVADMAGRLSSNSTTQATSGVALTTLHSYTVKANSLSANGKIAKIRAHGNANTSHAAAFTINCVYGGNSLQIITNNTNQVGDFLIEVEIMRTGASAEIRSATLLSSTATLNTVVVHDTPAVDTTVDQTLLINAQMGNAGDTVQLYMSYLLVY